MILWLRIFWGIVGSSHLSFSLGFCLGRCSLLRLGVRIPPMCWEPKWQHFCLITIGHFCNALIPRLVSLIKLIWIYLLLVTFIGLIFATLDLVRVMSHPFIPICSTVYFPSPIWNPYVKFAYFQTLYFFFSK